MPAPIHKPVNSLFEQFYRVTQLRSKAVRVDNASSEFLALAVALPPTTQHNYLEWITIHGVPLAGGKFKREI